MAIMYEQTPEYLHGLAEGDLEVLLNDVAERSKNEGWSLTRKAQDTIGSNEQEFAFQQAKSMYGEIQDVITIVRQKEDRSEQLDTLLEKYSIQHDINQFDLLRRVGRFDEAITSGEQTLQNAQTYDTQHDSENKALTFRTVQFLSQAYATKAHVALGEGDYLKAMGAYGNTVEFYNRLGIDDATGLTGIQLRIGRAQHTLNKLVVTEMTEDLYYDEIASPLFEKAEFDLRVAKEMLAMENQEAKETLIWESLRLHHLGDYHRLLTVASGSPDVHNSEIVIKHAMEKYQKAHDDSADFDSSSAGFATTYLLFQAQKNLPINQDIFDRLQDYHTSGKDYGAHNNPIFMWRYNKLLELTGK